MRADTHMMGRLDYLFFRLAGRLDGIDAAASTSVSDRTTTR